LGRHTIRQTGRDPINTSTDPYCTRRDKETFPRKIYFGGWRLAFCSAMEDNLRYDELFRYSSPCRERAQPGSDIYRENWEVHEKCEHRVHTSAEVTKFHDAFVGAVSTSQELRSRID
jgi:hypothetical protein